jgi:hypothetical protein
MPATPKGTPKQKPANDNPDDASEHAKKLREMLWRMVISRGPRR